MTFRKGCAHAMAIAVCAASGVTLPTVPRASAAADTNISPAASQSAYTVTDLGVLPHIADDVAMQINASGQIALWEATGDASASAAVWEDGARRSLPNPTGYLNGMARAINAQGQIAGWVSSSANAVDSAATVRGVIYTGRTPRLLGTLGGRNSRANGIDDRGRTVGVADLPDGGRHAFIDSGGRMTDLGVLPGGSFSEAFAINPQGDTVGVSDAAKGVTHAVLWHKGRIQDLGILTGGQFSSAQAINDRSQVTGFSDTGDGIHAFLMTKGRMQDLGTLGDDPSTAFSLNGRGDVVGASNVNERVRHAFLWRQGQMLDLNLFIPATSGWSLTEADAINDRGEIACVGSLKGGQPHALLLMPVGHDQSSSRRKGRL